MTIRESDQFGLPTPPRPYLLQYRPTELWEELSMLIRFFLRYGGVLFDDFSRLDKKMTTLVPKILEMMLTEEKGWYNTSTATVYCVARCFRVSEDGSLHVATAETNANMCLRVLSILRAGCCSRLLYYKQLNKGEHAAKVARDSCGDPAHEINDLISRLKHTLRESSSHRQRS